MSTEEGSITMSHSILSIVCDGHVRWDQAIDTTTPNHVKIHIAQSARVQNLVYGWPLGYKVSDTTIHHISVDF